MDLRRIFLDILRHWLEERGWSQREPARRPGVTSAAVSHRFTGARQPGLSTIENVARVPDVSPLELLTPRDDADYRAPTSK